MKPSDLHSLLKKKQHSEMPAMNHQTSIVASTLTATRKQPLYYKQQNKPFSNLVYSLSTEDSGELLKQKKRINHFPGAGHLCIKDQLYRVLKKQRALYGNIYNFTPLTFSLPNDYTKFLDIFMKRQDTSSFGVN